MMYFTQIHGFIYYISDRIRNIIPSKSIFYIQSQSQRDICDFLAALFLLGNNNIIYIQKKCLFASFSKVVKGVCDLVLLLRCVVLSGKEAP